MLKLLFSFSLIFHTIYCQEEKQCPFNHACKCTKSNPPNPLVYTYVQCISDELPLFFGDADHKYTINGPLYIISNKTYLIPTDHFLAFKFIQQLRLMQYAGMGDVAQKWSDMAFEEVEIEQLYIDGMNGALPPPAAVRRLGQRKLKKLRITQSPVTSSLAANIFQDLEDLEDLELTECKIKSIDEFAFSGLANLKNLSLKVNPIKALPANMIRHMKKLERLDLSSTSIRSVNYDDFRGPIALGDIDLSSALLMSMDLGVFAGLKSNLTVNLRFNNLIRNLTVSSLEKMPTNADISFWDNALEKVDTSVRDYLDKTEAKIDFFDSHMNCNGLDWLAKYVFCTHQVRVDEASCVDQRYNRMKEVLQKVPNPC